MLSLEEARARMLGRVSPTIEHIALADAVGRVLGESRVVAAVDVPPFANSAMDGGRCAPPMRPGGSVSSVSRRRNGLAGRR